MPVRVFLDDSPFDIADKIYQHFEVNQSCGIVGYIRMDEDTVIPKGELVVDRLFELDKADNFTKSGRRAKYIPGAIGGPLAQKIFKFQKTIIENVIKYTIWRVQ